MTKNLKQQSAKSFIADDDADEAQDAPWNDAQTSTFTLGRLLLDHAVPPAMRRRIIDEPRLALLLEAPRPSWVPPLRRALAAFSDWDHIETRDGGTGIKRKTEEGAERLSEMLATGQRVAIVSHAPERNVPAAFVAAADLTIRVPSPTDAIILAAIKAATGDAPRRLPTNVGRLDFGDLQGCIRVGSTWRRCIRRLVTASRRRFGGPLDQATIPHVRELRGYGAASDWALRLVEDVAAWRSDAKSTPWAALDASVVLGGPPGVGKTTFVASVGKSCNLPVISTSMAEWFSGTGYMDSVLRQMHAAFDAAKAAAPCVLFFDEADAIPNRANLDSRHIDYWSTIIGALLERLSDAAAGHSRLVLIAATNHAGRLDSALVRPGRFGRIIEIGRPTAADLEGILRQHLDGDLLHVDLGGVAAAGAGATGAQATAWVKGARRLARLASRPMEIDDLLAQVLPQDDRSVGERWRCAAHESGHAVIHHALGLGVVRRVSVVAAGRTGGHTLTTVVGDATTTKAGMQSLAMAALAGRAAEEVLGLGPSTGAHEDLSQATDIVTAIRVSFGLGGSLLHRAPMEQASRLLQGDPDLRRSVDRDLARLYDQTLALARLYLPLIEALARLLIETRIVDEDDFRALAETHDRSMVEVADSDAGGACHG